MLRAAAVFVIALTTSCGAKSEPVQMYRPSPNATIPFRIAFENQMSSTFQFVRLDLRLDGGRVLTDAQHAAVVERVRKGERAQFDLRLEPGAHMIDSLIEFRGSGQGSAPHLKAYRFEIRTGKSFSAAPNGVVTMITYEQSGPPEERPAVRFTESKMPAPAGSASSAP